MIKIKGLEFASKNWGEQILVSSHTIHVTHLPKLVREHLRVG